MRGLREFLRGCEKTHLGKDRLSFTRHRDIPFHNQGNIHIEYYVKKERAQGKYKIIKTELLIRQDIYGKESHWAKYEDGNFVNPDKHNNHNPIDIKVLIYLRKKHLPDYIQKQIPEVN
jgi:hypothetical protein